MKFGWRKPLWGKIFEAIFFANFSAKPFNFTFARYVLKRKQLYVTFQLYGTTVKSSDQIKLSLKPGKHLPIKLQLAVLVEVLGRKFKAEPKNRIPSCSNHAWGLTDFLGITETAQKRVSWPRHWFTMKKSIHDVMNSRQFTQWGEQVVCDILRIFPDFLASLVFQSWWRTSNENVLVVIWQQKCSCKTLVMSTKGGK